MTEIMDVASDMVNKSVPMDLGPGLSLRQAREARDRRCRAGAVVRRGRRGHQGRYPQW